VTARADTVGVVGAGAFGTALASVIARTGRRVVLWSRDRAVVDAIATTRTCPRLPEAPLPPPLEVTADPQQLAAEARFLVMAVVSTDVRARAVELGNVLDGSHIVVHAVGAFAAPANPGSASFERVSEVIAAGIPTLRIGALAGPALPADLAAGQFASMVVASAFDEVVSEARRLLNAPPVLRVYGTRDLAGVELAAALAGAYTVGLGLADGLAVSTGARAVIITRAVAEASRLGQAMGAEARTFAGLAGLGNLLVRATSHDRPAGGDRSSDYALGRRLAAGVVSGDATHTEGARAALAGVELARRHKLRMPLLDGIAAVIAGRAELHDAARLLGDNVAAEE
jgi:glycerol-3-phosphate dehydrogenase (NAD(P)+)